MKRRVTVRRLAGALGLAAGFFALLMPAAAQAQYLYGWTISGSPTDPNVNTAPAPTMGTRSLYLWCVCAGWQNELSAAEFDVSVPAGSSVLSFTPLNGFLNAGGAANLALATLCVSQSVVAGRLDVLDTGPGDYCLVPSTANGKNVSVDCTTFNEWRNDTVGFSNNNRVPACNDSWLCIFDAVEDLGWGRVKGLYR